METNQYSAAWMDFTKNEELICRQVKEATTAFAERRPLARRTVVLKSKAYTHEMLCRDGLARYFCNGEECASWDGEILTMAWGASYYCRVDQFLDRIRWKCIGPAYARARETGFPWPSWEKKEYNAFEIETNTFRIVARESRACVTYPGPVAYNLVRHEFPLDNPHTVRLMDWLVRKFVSAVQDREKYLSCIQGLGLPVPEELKTAFEEKLAQEPEVRGALAAGGFQSAA